MNTFELDKTYIANTYARFPVEIVSGQGALCRDADGNEYIDLGTGIGVNIFGYADAQWISAVTAQLNAVQHTSNLYYSAPCARLAEMLCQKTGMKKVFFSNSGAEANECAIKAARKYAADRCGGEYHVIVTLKNSFHGRTLATLAATGQEAFHAHFGPMPEGFAYAEANNIEDLRRVVLSHKTAGIFIEAVQGEGGVLPLTPEFAKAAEELARERDLLLMCDEVQIGNGRSGAFYGYMNLGITPDVVTTAKGLGGGLPIGATLLGARAAEVFSPGLNGSTFGGNPVAAAGAINIVGRIDEMLLAGVREKSKYLFDALENAPGVQNMTGMGLMIGIKPQREAGEVIEKCRAGGVLVIKAKDKLRLLPPLNIEKGLLEQAVHVMKGALK